MKASCPNVVSSCSKTTGLRKRKTVSRKNCKRKTIYERMRKRYIQGFITNFAEKDKLLEMLDKEKEWQVKLIKQKGKRLKMSKEFIGSETRKPKTRRLETRKKSFSI